MQPIIVNRIRFVATESPLDVSATSPFSKDLSLETCLFEVEELSSFSFVFPKDILVSFGETF